MFKSSTLIQSQKVSLMITAVDSASSADQVGCFLLCKLLADVAEVNVTKVKVGSCTLGTL